MESAERAAHRDTKPAWRSLQSEEQHATQRVAEREAETVAALFGRLKPDQIYVAGELSDPHGTHRLCLRILRDALGQAAQARAPWFAAAELWLYRGAMAPFEMVSITLLVAVVGAVAISRVRTAREKESDAADAEARKLAKAGGNN